MHASITFCSACRADRISPADFASPKLKAAVLFDPTILAATVRSCVFVRRKVERSKKANTIEATSKAAVEVAITIICSLCRIDKSKYERMSAPIERLSSRANCCSRLQFFTI